MTSTRTGLSHPKIVPLAWVAFVLLARQTDLFFRPQFWAEDATVLFIDARHQGWGSLFVSCGGYYILAQRLVACLTMYLPALFAPAIYCYGALAYTLLTAWFCLRARLDHLVDYRGRVGLALAVVLVPHGGELFMKLINAQWVLMPILLILILQEAPSGPRQAIVDFAGLLLVGMTGPYLMIYAPWFLLRLRRATGGWSRYNLWLVAVAWSLAIIQFLSVHSHPIVHPPGTTDPHLWTKELGLHLPGGLFFGAFVPTYLGRAFYVISPLLLALLGWALWRAENTRRWAALTLLGCGMTSYAGGTYQMASVLVVMTPFGNGARYFYPFYLFAMWVGVLFFYDASVQLRTAARVALAMMLLASASKFPGIVEPDPKWKKYAPLLDAGKEAKAVFVAPGWQVDFPAE